MAAPALVFEAYERALNWILSAILFSKVIFEMICSRLEFMIDTSLRLDIVLDTNQSRCLTRKKCFYRHA
jgi:hypothetical protein